MSRNAKTQERNCPVAGKCGACQTLNLSYERELSMKMKRIIPLLGRFGHIEEIIPMDHPFHYRNKVQYLFHYNGGRVNFGLYRASDGGIVRVDHCFAEDPEASAVCRAVKKMVDQRKLSVYDGRRGLIRHVMARRAVATGEILCAIVTSAEPFPEAGAFAEELGKRCPGLVSVSRIINSTETPLWMGGEETVLYGNGTITDVLCGCTFRISAKAFYQINPTQTEVLYRTAAEFADVKPGEHVLDAFCGIGTVGIAAAGTRCASLTGFDVNRDAIAAARENARLNGVANATFHIADDADFVMKDGVHRSVIFADPPRAGCSKAFLNAVMAHAPERFVYISCNPETLARDLAFVKSRYQVKRIQPVDMFPGTTHVETVVLLSRQKVDDFFRI